MKCNRCIHYNICLGYRGLDKDGDSNSCPYAEERPQGEWIVDEDAFSKDFRKCSNCNEDAEWLEGGCQFLPNYCPKCGADMRGGRE